MLIIGGKGMLGGAVENVAGPSAFTAWQKAECDELSHTHPHTKAVHSNTHTELCFHMSLFAEL